jgi:hypothetical protein
VGLPHGFKYPFHRLGTLAGKTDLVEFVVGASVRCWECQSEEIHPRLGKLQQYTSFS